MTKFIIFLVFTPNLIFSQNITGNYYSIENKCKLHLRIDNKNNFTFNPNSKKSFKGKVKISKEGNVTYLDFDKVSSVFVNDTLYIQNSGNSINPYWYFNECDEKYIHLVKRISRDSCIVGSSRKYYPKK